MPPAAPEAAPARSGDPVADALLGGALDELRRWAPRRLAVLLGGSVAAGEAVWLDHGGRRVTLSDLDFYVAVPDAAARAAARQRARDGLGPATARARALGLEAPLEAAFFTPRDLETLPARPATIELRRSALVLEGDPAWRARVPVWTAAQVSREERLLLLENRGFELLWARPRLAAAGLDALRARHAVLKTALDVAGATLLAAGEYPAGAGARVARARALAAPRGAPPGLDGAWAAALEWRRGAARALEPAAALAEWLVVARAWLAAWSREAGLAAADDPAAIARHAAGRAPWPGRWRRAMEHVSRSGRGPGLAARLARAAAGTPQHRVNATGVVLVAAAARGDGPRLGDHDRRALAALGVVPAAARGGLEAATAAAVRAWDDWLLDGTRAEAPE